MLHGPITATNALAASIIVWSVDDMSVHSSFKESKSEVSCMTYVGGDVNL